MRVRRLLPVLTLVGALLFAVAPAQAAAGSGCPMGFTLAPVSVLGTDFTGVADQVNNDGLVCIRFLRNGSGVFIDNVTP
jgi:hypothetical protein